MIASIIDQYKTLETLPGMKWSPQQRLLLASLLADRSATEIDRFERMTRIFAHKISRFSSVYKLRNIIPAFLCRLGLTAELAADAFFKAYEDVKAQELASSQPQFEAIVALLITLQDQVASTYSTSERITRVKDAYKEWRGLHSWLTNTSLLPVLAWATHSYTDLDRLVSDSETAYQHLRQAGLKQSMKTMQYAWLLTAKGLSIASAGPAFQQYKDEFRQKKIRGTTSVIQLLTLHGVEPAQAIPAVLQRYEDLQAAKSFRLIPKPILLRTATQDYLRELRAQSLAEQAVEQVGLEDNHLDLSLITDAMDAALIAVIITSSDFGGASAAGKDSGSDGGGSSCGSSDGGSSCGSSCGGGCGGGCGGS